ncbi:putative lipase [Escovopsis weberi]|uniref:Putative lipase n=1 Tax=Escovopsis weberi TaxID=150374 RepID=A0A0M8N8W1_ESCWE|nr:putative lipase [Escovopsis weberi]
MKNVAKSLRARFLDDELYIHVPKGNSGSFTYDGIELGGERVCAEIIDELRAVENRGGKITKLSIVGYSMGGLIARPDPGWFPYLWNFLGARTIAASGQQLFIVDDYRHTGRPLLAVMADSDSIFMNGLRMFKRHTLYSNIVNDRTTVYFTTCIEKTNPYKDPRELDVKFVDGYQGLVVDVSDSSPPRLQLLAPTTPSSMMTAALQADPTPS